MNLKQRKGITLVALVITIIVLLILAGISISALTNQGLFKKTEIAKEKYENAANNENTKLENYSDAINKYLVGTRLENNGELSNSTAITDFTPIVNLIGNNLEIIANANSDTLEIKGYIYIINDKVEKITENEKIIINGIELNKEYAIKVIAIDENAGIKASSIVNKKTPEIIYLLNGNDLKTDFTGGYEVKFSNTSQYNSYQIYEKYFYMTVAESGNTCTLTTKQKIDLTNIDSITFEISASANEATLQNTIYVGIANAIDSTRNFIKCESKTGTTITKQQITLDVSNIEGEYYIKVAGYHGTNISLYNTNVNTFSIYMK